MNKLWKKLMGCNVLFVGFVISVLAAIPILAIAKVIMICDPATPAGQAITIGLLILIIATIVFGIIGLVVKDTYKHLY